MNIPTTNHTHDRKILAEINLTPFVDIMLCLLIVFMVAAPLMQQGLDVNLPQAQAPIMERDDEDVILTVKKDGSIYLGDDNIPITLSTLEDKLDVIFEKKEKKDLYIKADEEVVYGRVVSVMAIAKQSGIERIGMITKPISTKKSKKEETKSTSIINGEPKTEGQS